MNREEIDQLRRNVEKVKRDMANIIPLEDMMTDEEVRTEIDRICKRQDEHYD